MIVGYVNIQRWQIVQYVMDSTRNGLTTTSL